MELDQAQTLVAKLIESELKSIIANQTLYSEYCSMIDQSYSYVDDEKLVKLD
jgi:hypothetical protein